jgi:sugar phosphate isomerase/epimerase
MAWKNAVHTISWSHRPLKDILSDASSAGFAGVELFQHPDELGGAGKILDEFAQSGLHLLGVASGSFDERCQLVRDLAALKAVKINDPSLPYVYVDEWQESDRRFKDAVNEGLTVAIHPHMYKPVQTMREAESILAKHPRLRFLPDVGHLRIAGEDSIKAIRDNFGRIDAIHIKDWR